MENRKNKKVTKHGPEAVLFTKGLESWLKI